MIYKDSAGISSICPKCNTGYRGQSCPKCNVTKMDLAWAVLKAMKPHRQKVLPAGADKHLKLQSWANKQAFAEKLLGDEATARRDALMREAVADPTKHGLRFIDGEPIPFDDSLPDAGKMGGGDIEPQQPMKRQGQTSLDDF